MVKKSIQVYVSKEGKEAALKLTKKEKEKFGTHIKQFDVISDILINHESLVDRLSELEKELEELKNK